MGGRFTQISVAKASTLFAAGSTPSLMKYEIANVCFPMMTFAASQNNIAIERSNVAIFGRDDLAAFTCYERIQFLYDSQTGKSRVLSV